VTQAFKRAAGPSAPGVEPRNPAPRSADMVDKRQIEAALAEYNVRAACTIVDLGVLMLDLIDVQSPAVLEALVEEAQRRHITGPRNRQEVRETLIR
jgi:MoxR-like ATPase